jgi:hypothetical protein
MDEYQHVAIKVNGTAWTPQWWPTGLSDLDDLETTITLEE